MIDVKEKYVVKIVCKNYTWTFPFKGKLEFDPANPPEEWGQPCFISLKSEDIKFPTIAVEIPDGCKPVLHTVVRQSMLDGSAVRKLRVGYRQEHTRYMHVVDIDGKTSYETDTI